MTNKFFYSALFAAAVWTGFSVAQSGVSKITRVAASEGASSADPILRFNVDLSPKEQTQLLGLVAQGKLGDLNGMIVTSPDGQILFIGNKLSFEKLEIEILKFRKNTSLRDKFFVPQDPPGGA